MCIPATMLVALKKDTIRLARAQVEGICYYIRVDLVNYSNCFHPIGEDPWLIEPDGYSKSLKQKFRPITAMILGTEPKQNLRPANRFARGLLLNPKFLYRNPSQYRNSKLTNDQKHFEF